MTEGLWSRETCRKGYTGGSNLKRNLEIESIRQEFFLKQISLDLDYKCD